MLIHGRLILTSNGLMLDETKSLLQKSLRRKDTELITQSAKELLAYGKDQLPWKSLITFLFEDHCLSHVSILEKVYQCFVSNDKYKAVEVLSHSYTCRIAACLPVISLDNEYAPDYINTDPPIEIPDDEQRLMPHTSGQLNVELICAHLKKAWTEKDTKRLIICMKLLSMVNDIEKVHVTSKGCLYLIRQPKKPNVGHIVMSMLYNLTSDPYFKRYFKVCFDLLSTPDVCVRLVLFAPVVHLMFFGNVSDPGDAPVLPWNQTATLTRIPDWAVDKHTFRGKFGKGVSHLIKKKHPAPRLEPELFKEFYHERPKSDINTFFNVGCVCNKKSVETNPYWERTTEIYFEQTKSKQKTVKMTQDYYKQLKQNYKYIFVAPRPKSVARHKNGSQDNAEVAHGNHGNRDGATSSDVGTKRTRSHTQVALKRKKDSIASNESPVKNQKLDNTGAASSTSVEKLKQSNDENSDIEKSNRASFSSLGLKGPLLQLPTGSAKVYACVNLDDQQVWKGPYRKNRLNLALFLHRAMQTLGDPHTLEVENHDPYLVFPLLKGEDATMKVEERGFYDAISKKSIPDGQFVDRSALGISQLHRLTLTEIHKLPVTIWLHFCYRFALNVGDSGIYNAITDSTRSTVYGIDLEETRGSVKGSEFIDLIFTKRPRRELCTAITAVLLNEKKSLQNKLSVDNMNVDAIQDIANELQVYFDRQSFCKRIRTLFTASKKISSLKKPW